MKLFDVEANNGPTIKFQVIPPEIEDKLHSSCTKLLAVQKNMRKIREATKRKLVSVTLYIFYYKWNKFILFSTNYYQS